MSYGKAGCEDPATSQRSDVIATKHVMPTAAMAGSFSRKIPSPVKAGQDVAGSSNNQVQITTVDSEPGKQTWKGSREGFTVRTAPKVTPAKVGLNTGESVGGKQQVKGVQGKKAPSESKPAHGA